MPWRKVTDKVKTPEMDYIEIIDKIVNEACVKIKEEEDAAKRITGHTVITPLLEATLFNHKQGYLALFKA